MPRLHTSHTASFYRTTGNGYRRVARSDSAGACLRNLRVHSGRRPCPEFEPSLEEPSPDGDRKLKNALDYAARKAVIVVAAAGNQGIISGSALTRHPWVLPVSACNLRGRPAAYSNIANSIRRNGLLAPGEKITSLGSNSQSAKFCGTSTAVPFVTGAIALLWSVLPGASARNIKKALTDFSRRNRSSLSPPLLNAWGAYHSMRQNDLTGFMKRYGEKKAA